MSNADYLRARAERWATEGLCTRCGQERALEGRRMGEGCRLASQKWRADNPGYRLKWQRDNREQVRAYFRRVQRELRAEVLAGYGDRCGCCGETEPVFLTLDHVNGGGRAHRKRVSQTEIYRRIIRAGFPPEYQVLCWNCHMAKDKHGRCPHQG